MGLTSRWEYLKAIYLRYRQADRWEKQAIWNEFCRDASYNRKYAIRLLNGPVPGQQRPRRRHCSPTYSGEVISVLGAIWELAAYPCGTRLKAILTLWMPQLRKRFRLRPAMERSLLRISARQIDRRLQARKRRTKRRLYGRTRPGTRMNSFQTMFPRVSTLFMRSWTTPLGSRSPDAKPGFASEITSARRTQRQPAGNWRLFLISDIERPHILTGLQRAIITAVAGEIS